MKSGEKTIVAVMRDRVACCAAGECTEQARPPGATEADAVRLLLKNVKNPGQVILFTDAAFTQRIPLSRAQSAGLSPEELERALAFEAEPFSGIPAAEAALGYLPDGPEAWRVAAIPLAARAELHAAVRTAGGRLAGISHAQDAPRHGSLAEWLSTPGITEGSRPLIPPPARQASPGRFRTAALAGVAAALVALAALSFWQKARLRRFSGENSAHAALTSRAADLTRQREALNLELQALERDTALRAEITRRRGAAGALLAALAARCGENVLVQKMEAQNASEITVSGIALDAEGADSLSIALTGDLQQAGWVARPGRKTGLQQTGGGGPWEFSILLTHRETLQAAPASRRGEVLE